MGPCNRSCIHRVSGSTEIKVPKRYDCTGFERDVEKCRERHHFRCMRQISTTTGFQEASEKRQRQEKRYEGSAGDYHSGCSNR
ncbi:hypothetical protein ARMGADRAFT_1016636 [Armillaria gallica]|uniref:Uncharacterized protein n=1 Tax=Armillaria gallica TaxID=47427 RepID=A0A2H3D184_ARMGA|nr:hypothetical protein ARMGADRAFT_1016636 [Armillaria gallica]